MTEPKTFPPAFTQQTKHMKDVQFSLEKISQAHSDLAKLCELVCSSYGKSVDTFNDLIRIQRNIDSVCETIDSYTDDSRFYEIHEECDLAEKFLTCLILTVWQADRPPITPQQPLDWREANVIYCVMFSAMHRLGNALQAIKAVIV